MIHPVSAADVVEVMRSSSASGRRLLVVGGRRHIDKGNPSEVDAELWTTQLDGIVAYEPAEMICVVEAGVRVGTLESILAEGGQEWPSDAPDDATVGGVIAAAATSPRRLRVGAVRDTVLEVELVTGDGRLLRGGARTVKNVTGYDLPRLAAGSLGTLGVIVQVALKVRPLAKGARTLRAPSGDGLALARRILDAVPVPAGVVAAPDGVEVRLEGWPAEVELMAASAARLARFADVDPGVRFPTHRPWDAAPVLVEAAVPPSRVAALISDVDAEWGTLAGVGIAWVGLPSSGDGLAALRARAAAFTGVAPVIRGRGGLGPGPAAAEIHRRLRRAFDPAAILAPGRGWGEAEREASERGWATERGDPA
jgi:glycolate oxidase FAD binding subunit